MTKRKTMRFPTRLVLSAPLLVAALFSSCKKSDQIEAYQVQNSPLNSFSLARERSADSALTLRITSFYNEISAIRSGSSSCKLLTIDSAEFLTEAAINFNHSHWDAMKDQQLVEFKIVKPCSNGTISLGKVSEAYFQIADSIRSVLATFSYQDRTLSFLDLRIDEVGTAAEFKALAVFIKGDVPYIPTGISENLKVVVDDNTRGTNAWRVYAQGANTSNAVVGEYIGTVNATTKTVSNVQSGPGIYGAATTLRTVGSSNYFQSYGGFTAMTQYQMLANIHTTVSDNPTFAAGGGPFPNYTYWNAAPKYIGYDHYSTQVSQRWNAREYFTTQGSLTSFASNNDLTFLYYLTTPMMNHYLGFIPDIIHQDDLYAKATWGNDQIFLNFGVVLNQLSADSKTDGTNVHAPLYFVERNHRYLITHGAVVDRIITE